VKAVHDQKVRTLMRSINLLQEQVTSLKSQDKEHRRSALIQNLRKHQKEQDYIIDILKETLIAKIPDFQESLEMVRDFDAIWL
jgi:NADH:ubiquinone oxidoreductase subunit E